MNEREPRYYVRYRGRVSKPVTMNQLLEAARRGKLTRLHEISRDGKEWRRVEDWNEFLGQDLLVEGEHQQRQSGDQQTYTAPQSFQQPQQNNVQTPSSASETTQQEQLQTPESVETDKHTDAHGSISNHSHVHASRESYPSSEANRSSQGRISQAPTVLSHTHDSGRSPAKENGFGITGFSLSAVSFFIPHFMFLMNSPSNSANYESVLRLLVGVAFAAAMLGLVFSMVGVRSGGGRVLAIAGLATSTIAVAGWSWVLLVIIIVQATLSGRI